MRNLWKWVLGILGGLVVLGIIAAAFFVRFFWRAPMMAAQRGFVPRTIPNPGPGVQRMPHMFGGMRGFGGFGPFGQFGHMGFGRGGLLMFLPHLLWQLLLLALIVAGVIFLVRALSRPRAGGMQAVSASPVPPVAPVAAAAMAVPPAPVESATVEQAPLRTCASCGRELQADWTHCPHCGAKVQA